MNEKTFKEAMLTISSVYSQLNPLPPVLAKVWWQSLKPYSDEQVNKAIMEYISDPDLSKFAPKPGDIIGKITGNGKQAEISIDDSALSAWNLILSEIRRVGIYGNLDIDDKLALKAVQSIGGWKSLCYSTDDALKTWKRKEFISAYKTFYGSNNLPSSLKGIAGNSTDKIESSSQLSAIANKVNSINGGAK